MCCAGGLGGTIVIPEKLQWRLLLPDLGHRRMRAVGVGTERADVTLRACVCVSPKSVVILHYSYRCRGRFLITKACAHSHYQRDWRRAGRADVVARAVRNSAGSGAYAHELGALHGADDVGARAHGTRLVQVKFGGPRGSRASRGTPPAHVG